jgi:hypothetical protein
VPVRENKGFEALVTRCVKGLLDNGESYEESLRVLERFFGPLDEEAKQNVTEYLELRRKTEEKDEIETD